MMYPSQEQQPSGAEPSSQARPYSSPPGAYPYPPQGPYNPSPTDGNPYPYAQQQEPYMPPPGAAPYTQQGPYTPPPGAGSYPYPPQQGPYYAPPQYSVPVSNTTANRAMVYSFISIALGAITFATSFGSAGIITGALAIFYGITGLNISKRLPNRSGRTQAITAIVLGVTACFLVLLSLAIRSMNTPY